MINSDSVCRRLEIFGVRLAAPVYCSIASLGVVVSSLHLEGSRIGGLEHTTAEADRRAELTAPTGGTVMRRPDLWTSILNGTILLMLIYV